MSSNDSNLEIGVPKIIITEPSPAPVASAAGRVPANIPSPKPQTRQPQGEQQQQQPQGEQQQQQQQPPTSTASPNPDEVQPVPNPEPSSDNVERTAMSVPEGVSLDVSGGFHPAEEATECTVRVGSDSSSVPNVETEATDNESSEDERERRSCWDIATKYCRKFDGIRHDSKYIFLTQLVFLIIPMSAGYMGGAYMDRCPMSASTPYFLFMMGLTGMIIILCRMLMLVQKMFEPERNNSSVLSTIITFGNVIIIIFLCTEMVAFMRTSPSFHETDSNYCHKTFHTFTYWMNWCGLFFIILMVVMCAPKKCARNAEAEPV